MSPRSPNTVRLAVVLSACGLMLVILAPTSSAGPTGRVVSERLISERVRKSVKDLLTKKSQRSSQASRPSSPRAPHLSIRYHPALTITGELFERVQLECEAGGNPPPEIHWLKNGQRLIKPDEPTTIQEKVPVASESSAVVTSSEETMNTLGLSSAISREQPELLGLSFTRSKLSLDCLTASDAATYTCVAQNPFQRVTADTQLIVKEIDEEMEENRDEDAENSRTLCQAKKKESANGAQIHMWTHTRLELIGNDLKLYCRASGSPRPEITWMGPDNSILVNGYRHETLATGDLLLHNLSWKDMGSYTCIADNKVSTDRISTFLYPALPETSH